MFGVALYAGLTMVTNVPFYSFKDVQMKKSVPFAVIVLIALGIAVINIHPPLVLFALFVRLWPVAATRVYGWRKAKGQPRQRDQHLHRRARRARPASSDHAPTVLHSRP